MVVPGRRPGLLGDAGKSPQFFHILICPKRAKSGDLLCPGAFIYTRTHTLTLHRGRHHHPASLAGNFRIRLTVETGYLKIYDFPKAENSFPVSQLQDLLERSSSV